jgi:hypothetical protein
VPALEAAVDHLRVVGLAVEHRGERIAQRGRAARAAGGAEVQVRQLALEQPRQPALDAVAVEQHDVAMRRAHALQFVPQRIVVRAPVGLDPLLHLGVAGCLAVPVQRLSREETRRAQLGVVRARVHRRVVARAIEVDDVAAVARHQQAGAELVACEGVQAVEVPVGVFDVQCARHQTVAQVGGNLAPAVRHADDERRAAAVQGEGGVGHVGCSWPPTTVRVQGRWPKV